MFSLNLHDPLGPWLKFTSGEVSASVGWAETRFPLTPSLVQWAELLEGLSKLREDRAGHLIWEIEGRLTLTFVMAKRGELSVTAALRGGDDLRDELTILLTLQQTDLPLLIEALGD